jgi:pimeloyl-ACP methyl ester carboxylesterase
MTSPRRARTAALPTFAALTFLTAACTTDHTGAPDMTTTTITTTTTTDTTAIPSTVAVNGTTLHVERRGSGMPLLLIHGGGEDAAMLQAQAADLATAGHDVVTYDRRGTGRSGRESWPGDGAEQHAADAAALLEALGWTDATVVGVSSGGVIALDLVARHPERVGRVVAWEPPAAGVVPGGGEISAAIMAPVEAHLAAHPGDFVGAQAILLSAVVGFPVTVDDQAFAAARANAEPFVRDEPNITLAELDQEALGSADVTIGIGSSPNELVAAAAEVLAASTGGPPLGVDAGHEVYLTDPAVLTGIVAGAVER